MSSSSVPLASAIFVHYVHFIMCVPDDLSPKLLAAFGIMIITSEENFKRTKKSVQKLSDMIKVNTSIPKIMSRAT